MHRRSFLATGATTLAVAVGVRAGRGATAPADPGFGPLGTLSVDGVSEAVVDPSATVVYGALRDGFVVVDISDPANPRELARVTEILPNSEAGPVTDIYDVKVDGDRLVVGGPHVGTGPDTATGFEVYDVADPANPSLIAGTETDHAIHNGFISGTTVYLTGTSIHRSPLVVYDVSNGTIEELSRWSVIDAEPTWESVDRDYRSCHDVYVQDDVAFVAYWDAGTWLLDVSDPTAPEPIANPGGLDPATLPANPDVPFPPGVRELPGNSHYAQPSPDGTVLAVGKEASDDADTTLDGGAGGIEIWDVADPTAPQRLTIIAPPVRGETSHNFGWRDRHLYTSWYGGGVHVYDLSDPASPTHLAGWSAEDTTAFWTAKPASDAIVGSSYLDPSIEDEEKRREGVGATLYTFPYPERGESRQAEALTPRPTPTVTPTATPLPITTTTTTTKTTPPMTPTPTTTEPEPGPSPARTAPETTTSTEASGPGFGVLTTLAAGALATWRLLGRDDDRRD